MKKYKAFRFDIDILAREQLGEWESKLKATNLTATSVRELKRKVNAEINITLEEDIKHF